MRVTFEKNTSSQTYYLKNNYMKKPNYILVFLLVSITYLVVFSGYLYAQNKNVFYPEKFNSVSASGMFTIVLVQSDSTRIECYGDDCKLEYSVTNGTLELKRVGNFTKMDYVKVYSPDFYEFSFSGASEVSNEGKIMSDVLKFTCSGATELSITAESREIYLVLSGGSDANFKGITNKFDINTSGASEVSAYSLKANEVHVKSSGASDIYINADSLLVAKMSGASSLKYEREPKIKEIELNDITSEVESVDSIFTSELDSIIKPLTNWKNKKRDRFKGNWTGLELGVNGYLNNQNTLELPNNYDFLSLNYSKSLNFNYNFFQQSLPIIGKRFGMVTGLGFHWNNYKFDNLTTTLKEGPNGITGYYDMDSTKNYQKSKLTVTYLVVPLLFEFQTNRFHDLNSFHISAGVIGGVRIGTHTKQEYTTDNGTSKPKVYDDFYLNPYKLDATVRLGWGSLNLYSTYSLVPMFRNNKGPELYPFTVGIILPFS